MYFREIFGRYSGVLAYTVQLDELFKVAPSNSLQFAKALIEVLATLITSGMRTGSNLSAESIL